MEKKSKDIKSQLQQGYKLQTLMHKVNKETLKIQHKKRQKKRAVGIDEITKEKYDENIEENLDNLLEKMKKFSYKPLPVRRTYIPKANGKQRPLGIPAYEDKLVQGAMTDVLNEIYENIFLECSYGFRKERNSHQAIKYINDTIMFKKINYIVDADIKGFFDNVNHDWLMKFLEHNIADKNFLRYIKRFLISGYMEDMKYYETEKGTPQGGLISPVLANVYLHFVLDLWVEKYIKQRCKGDIYLVRYADDFLVMFQYENEARLFLKELKERFEKFGLELEPTKTRIISFGRYKGTKEKFDFLGFTFYNGISRKGKYRIVIKTSKKKMKQKRETIKKWIKDNMHENIIETLDKIKLKLVGHYNYYGVSGNTKDLMCFYWYVKTTYFRALQRRGQKHPIPYEKYISYWNAMKIPMPKICVNIWA